MSTPLGYSGVYRVGAGERATPAQLTGLVWLNFELSLLDPYTASCDVC